jgi:D-lactate dehydrogenase (cytochrome)
MAIPRRLSTRLASSSPQYQTLASQSRCLYASRRLYATEKKANKQDGSQESSFKGQLYNSVYDRIQREKKDEARFAVYRDVLRSGGGQWVLPFGMLVLQPRTMSPGTKHQPG